MAEVIHPDGRVISVKPTQGTTFTLEELQSTVGGFIEIVTTYDNRWMVINEEGKLNGLPYNPAATERYINGVVDPIVGVALVCELDEID